MENSLLCNEGQDLCSIYAYTLHTIKIYIHFILQHLFTYLNKVGYYKISPLIILAPLPPPIYSSFGYLRLQNHYKSSVHKLCKVHYKLCSYLSTFNFLSTVPLFNNMLESQYIEKHCINMGTSFHSPHLLICRNFKNFYHCFILLFISIKLELT